MLKFIDLCFTTKTLPMFRKLGNIRHVYDMYEFNKQATTNIRKDKYTA